MKNQNRVNRNDKSEVAENQPLVSFEVPITHASPRQKARSSKSKKAFRPLFNLRTSDDDAIRLAARCMNMTMQQVFSHLVYGFSQEAERHVGIPLWKMASLSESQVRAIRARTYALSNLGRERCLVPEKN